MSRIKNALLLLCALAVPACGVSEATVDAAAGADTSEAPALLSACNPLDPDCEPPLGGTGCTTVTAAPPTSRTGFTYSCDVTLTDLLARPVAGRPVTLTASWCNRAGTTETGVATGVTGANGRAVVSVVTGGANRLHCNVSTPEAIATSRTASSTLRMASGTRVGPFAASSYPVPTATRSVTGFVAGAAQMDLYQSGTYDRVVIIPEYFDVHENDSMRRRTRNQFFKETSALVKYLFDQGIDVWLFQPSHTGENLHEQAAELAQAIDTAARRYATPTCASNRVGLMGLNTAGVVARMATARWEADASWRTSLGLPAALPVAFLGSLDAPQYGLNLNTDLQKLIQDEVSGTDINKNYNIDSCAFNQLLRRQYRPGAGVTTAPFKAFFVDGAPTTFYSKRLGQVVTCAAGPAVATLNASRGVPGWPTTPRRYGASFGGRSYGNECYGDSRDHNASGENVCKYMSDLTNGTYLSPRVNDSFVKLVVNNWSDRYLNASAEDLQPGSRAPFLLDGQLKDGFFDVNARQRFSPTFIPFRSAQGTEGPVGSALFGTVASPFSDQNWAETTYSAVSDSPPLLTVLPVLNALGSSLQCSMVVLPIGGILQR